LKKKSCEKCFEEEREVLGKVITYFPLIGHGPHRKLKNQGGDMYIHRQQGDIISLIIQKK
jgi:hypothetical protein